MPALANPPAVLSRFVPHRSDGASAGAGPFSKPGTNPGTNPGPKPGPEHPFVPTQKKGTKDSIDRLAHDARNILSGLTLYSELLSAPGVLTKAHTHYAKDLEGIAKNVAQILEKIVACMPGAFVTASTQNPAFPLTSAPPIRAAPLTDLATELRHLQPLLSAIAGPVIRLSIATMPCAGRTALAVEDLTRILVNLVRNSTDAMPTGGDIRITAQYGDGLSYIDSDYAIGFGPPYSVLLTVSDDGPGIPVSARERIFDPGFTTRTRSDQVSSRVPSEWPSPRRRGLGLSIVRNLVEAAGGSVRALANHNRGARFEISLPLCDSVTSGTYVMPPSSTFPADSRAKGCIECQ
jgi:signal transduction histidine kinase